MVGCNVAAGVVVDVAVGVCGWGVCCVGVSVGAVVVVIDIPDGIGGCGVAVVDVGVVVGCRYVGGGVFFVTVGVVIAYAVICGVAGCDCVICWCCCCCGCGCDCCCCLWCCLRCCRRWSALMLVWVYDLTVSVL